jgi:hypothetical protein
VEAAWTLKAGYKKRKDPLAKPAQIAIGYK